MSSRPASRGARLRYRALLRLLPGEVRERFGADMEELFLRRLSEARGSRARAVDVWGRAVADIALQAITMRIVTRPAEGGGMGTLGRDIRDGVRSALRAPGLAVVVVTTLALGIGASTATFSVVHAVLLKPLPFDDPDELVIVWPEVNANKAMALMAAERMPSLEAVSGVSGWTLTLTGEGEPIELVGLQVQPGYFEMLGVDPILGRTFAPDEDLPGRDGVVILSHPFWVRGFGADPDVVGRVIAIGGADHDSREVIGVMPAGVETLLESVDAWIPLAGDRALGLAADRTWYVNERLARLAPGATLAQANSEVLSYARDIQKEIPDHFSEEEAARATVRPLRAYLARDVRDVTWVAFGAVGLVLLIACFNVTNLLLARGDTRIRDLSMRAALGAGRLRLTRMLLAEIAVLGVAGGALGVVTAVGLVRLVVRLAPETFPGIADVSVNANVLGFAVAATLLATAIAGLAPVVRLGRTDGSASLAGGGRGTGGSGGGRLTPLLIGGQIALAVMVAVGSGLMLRSLNTLLAVDPGLDGSGVIAFNANAPVGRYPDVALFKHYYEEVIGAVEALPAVESVGAIHLLPGTRSNWSFPTFPDGIVVAEGQPDPQSNFRAVAGDYFQTVRVPLVEGRLLSDTDRADTEPVVVVNEAFVSTFYPDGQALDKTVSIYSPTNTRHRIVGVVGDVHQHGREIEPLPEVYFPFGQVSNQMSMWVVARVRSGDPLAHAGTIQDVVWSIDADVPITGITELDTSLGESTKGPRFLTALLSAFGLLAVGLSATGVFGVTAYTSGRRLPEFGVRLALGATRSGVVRAAVNRSLVPVLMGLVIGLFGAAASSRVLRSVLFEVEPGDPLTFTAVGVGLALVGLSASVVPAWRASRVDPVSVLARE